MGAVIQCRHEKCGSAAVVYPVMLFYASRKRWPKAPPARAVCDIPTCEAHKKLVTLEYLLTDEGFEGICRMFLQGGKARPDRSATELEFIDIESEEARDYRRSKYRRFN